MRDTAFRHVAHGSTVGIRIAGAAYRAQDSPDHLADQNWTLAMLKEQHHRYNRQYDTEMHAPPAQQALVKWFPCQVREVQKRMEQPTTDAWSSRTSEFN